MPNPPAPLTRFVLRFAGVEIPVAVYPGIRDNGMRRDTYIKAEDDTMVPARRVYVPADRSSTSFSQVVNPDAVVRMTIVDGEVTPLSDVDVARAVMGDDLRVDINEFVSMSMLNDATLPTEATYHLRPIRALTGRVNDPTQVVRRVFSTLCAAMEAENTAAIIPLALHGKPRYAALTADGRLFTLRNSAEQVPPPELEVVDPVGRDVLAMRMFIAVNTSIVATPPFDNSRELISSYIDRRTRNEVPDEIPPPVRVPATNLRDLIVSSMREAVNPGFSSPLEEVSPSPSPLDEMISPISVEEANAAARAVARELLNRPPPTDSVYRRLNESIRNYPVPPGMTQFENVRLTDEDVPSEWRVHLDPEPPPF